jgi:hypothetical protein
MVLEVENTLGLELTCFLPPVPGAGSKRLRVSSEVCVPLDFDLARGAHTAVGFRVPSIRRHRIRMTSDLENGSDREQGFQLRGLAAVAPPFEGIND